MDTRMRMTEVRVPQRWSAFFVGRGLLPRSLPAASLDDARQGAQAQLRERAHQ